MNQHGYVTRSSSARCSKYFCCISTDKPIIWSLQMAMFVHYSTHTHRHTDTHTYTHTDSHSHTVRITHHIWACHRKMEHSTDTHTVRTTYHGGWTALAAFCLQQWSLLTCVQGLGPAVNSLHGSAKQHSIYKSPLMQYVSTMTSRKYKLKTQAYTEKREDRAG